MHLTIINKSNQFGHKDKMTETTISDRVKIKLRKTTYVGTVKFIGEMKDKEGIWYGVELDKANKGDNLGMARGIRYFSTIRNKGIFIKQSEILKTNNKNNDAPRITVGDIVKVKKLKCHGIVRFIGPTNFKSGIWYGLQLEKPNGTNDGIIKKRKYFKCQDKYGAFLQSKAIKKIPDMKLIKRPAIIANNEHKLSQSSFWQNNPALIGKEVFLYPMFRWEQFIYQTDSGYTKTLDVSFRLKFRGRYASETPDVVIPTETHLAVSNQQYKRRMYEIFKPHLDILSIVDVILLYNGLNVLPIRYSVDLLPYFHTSVRHTDSRKNVWDKAVNQYKNTGKCSVDFIPIKSEIIQDIYDEFIQHIRNEFSLRSELQEEAVFFMPDNAFITVSSKTMNTKTMNTKTMFTRLYVVALTNLFTKQCKHKQYKEYMFPLDLVGINYRYYNQYKVYPRQSSWSYGSRSRCWSGHGLVLLNNGNKKQIFDLCVGDEVAVLNRLPYGMITGCKSAIVKVKIESIVNREYEMVHVDNKMWITPYHAVLVKDNHDQSNKLQWRMPYDLNKIKKRMVSSIFNFILDRGHVLCVNGIWANTLGHDLCGDVIQHPIWGSSKVMSNMFGTANGYPNVVEYI